MKSWQLLETARAPDGDELSLWRRGEELVVRSRGAELMSNREHASEEALAELGCHRLRPNARVLIGGIGLGYTLRAALAVLPGGATVHVSEVVGALVDWIRTHAGGASALDDPRVQVSIEDVGVTIDKCRSELDAILLDVDNGPSALVLATNARLYGMRGLEAARRALTPTGRLAVWSAGPAPAFLRRLQRAGFEARAVEVRSRGVQGARHVVFLGERRNRAPRRSDDT